MVMVWYSTLDRRFPYKEGEQRESLVTCFPMIGPIKLSHFTSGTGLIGKSDEHRTQTTLKRAGCLDDKKYLRCAALVNQVHTRIVSKKCRHEEQP